MAAEQPTMPINGNYQAQNAPGAAGPDYGSNASTGYITTATSSGNNGNAHGIPKDEVGWYFVEQYYTTLSCSPERLYLYYNKRSQFVSGLEVDKVPVSIGQKAINDRIREQGWEDAKVRVTNVDSQGSDQNIVIQVIGEISNRSAPHRRFCQTFVLAAQTNGYFVLNDIFRFLREEEDETEDEEVTDSGALEPTGIHEPAPTGISTLVKGTGAPETVTQAKEAEEVDYKLEEAIQKEEAVAAEVSAPAAVNGTPEPTAHAPVEEPPAVSLPAAKDTPSAPPSEAPAPKATESEKPKDATSAAKPTAPAPAPKPAVPKTWATLAAAAANTGTAAPAATPAAAPAATQAKSAAAVAAAPATTAPAPAAASTTATPPTRQESPANNEGETGWQTAGADKQQRATRVPPQGGVPENQGVRAYIKNVHESVDGDALKKTLSKYGELAYFDISRQKNCAFVDFATAAGFQAAVAANPHQIGNDTIYVEERRVRPTSFQSPRGVGRGRGNFDNRPGQGRGGFPKDGGRGGFNPRGRGTMTPRGRGGSQAA